jgi:hypothetical protein
MALRDYFAAKAMQGLLGCQNNWGEHQLANNAYFLADAMLEARK